MHEKIDMTEAFAQFASHFKDMPAIRNAAILENMGYQFTDIMSKTYKCEITEALTSFSRFTMLADEFRAGAINAYEVRGLIAKKEMQDVLQRTNEFVTEAIPKAIAKVLGSNCNCREAWTPDKDTTSRMYRGKY